MFEDVKEEDVLNTLKNVDQNKQLRDTPYGLWFHSNTYSPAGIISKVYELRGNLINRKTFTTDIAQKRLLQLGFPIVENDNDFFNEKELNSFVKLIERKTYNENNPVDKNIGYFLNKVIWTKTQKWAKGLEDEYGWNVKGSKNWNKRNGSDGQAYKQYTWWRIYPDKDTKSLFFYTVGMHTDGQLLYKMDIKRDDSFFSTDPHKINKFEAFRDQKGLGWKKISHGELKDLDWDSLITRTHEFFEKGLKSFYEIKNEFQPDERLMRLTWNDNNWEYPSGHFYKSSNQGNSDIAYEKQYGYGHEEWLFNTRYRLGEYQYGYIRGVDGLSADAYFLKKIILYSFKEINNDRCLIGHISNVHILDEGDIEDFELLYNEHKEEMISELRAVGADWQHFKKEGLFPNVKFKWTDFEQFNEPIRSEYLKSKQFNRFQPIKLTSEISDNLFKEIENPNTFKFKAGKSDGVDSYTKKTKKTSTTVNKIHVTTVDALYEHLKVHENYNENQLSAESSIIGGAIPDMVIEEKDGYTIFEVKSSSIALKNIRQGLGQILEYAFLDNTLKIKKLVIVGPAPLLKLKNNT